MMFRNGVIGTVLAFMLFFTASAAAGQENERPLPSEKEEREIVAMLELLEMLEMLKDLEVLADLEEEKK